MIPRIIHQSYKSAEHPYPKHWQRSWTENNAGWDYRFHTDRDNLEIVATHFPEFLEAYEAFPRGIMRADFARFLYLYLWGGVYADLDYACLKPFADLIDGSIRIGIPELPENTYYHYHNALLLSEEGNPFWLHCAKQAVSYFRASKSPQVEHLAGPFRLQAALKSEKPHFTALPRHQVTPFDWFSFVGWGKPDEKLTLLSRQIRNLPIEDVRKHFPEAYALTFWDHKW